MVERYLNEQVDIHAPIRKIIIGNDPIQGMAIVVGQSYSGYNVVSIERSAKDTSHFFIYACGKDGIVRIWKESIGQPVFLEFDQRVEGY
jgi:hypothetical protein